MNTSLKITYALYFGNRGFFPGEVIASARAEMIEAIKKNGFDYICMDENLTRYGAVETRKEGQQFAKFLEEPKFVHRYGYYECRCKFQKDPETMWSAFWLQSPSIGTRIEPEWCGIESDIMEHFKDRRAECGNIMGGYGKQFKEEGRIRYDFEETEDGWHYFV